VRGRSQFARVATLMLHPTPIPLPGERYGVLSVQKVFSGSTRAGRLRLMGKNIGHRHVARPEPDNTFWTDSTGIYKSVVVLLSKDTLKRGKECKPNK